uniref:G-protein coupled receptors family 2 profile 2 domain-containing protein n=1 Tax=Biomphalaria glabrata TaxID=6526 RepID=A0A2C9KSI4_BIOGL
MAPTWGLSFRPHMKGGIHAEGQCFSLLCAPGKKLINGKCSTVLSEIKGLGYSLRLWLMSSTEIPKQVRHALPFIPHSYLFDRLRTKLNDYLVNIMDSSKINISLITAASDRLDDRRTLRKPVVFLLSGHIVASQDLGRDEFEGALTDALLSPWKNLSLANGVEAEFIPSLSLRSNNSLCETIFVPSHGKISCGVSEVSPNVTSDENAVLWNVRDSFLNVSHLLSCSFVAFNKSHFNRVITDATIPTTVKIIVNFGDNKITFQDPADMNYMHIGDDGKLNVCRDLLDKYVHSSEDVEFLGLSQGNGDDENRAAQYVLTMVCMGTSILSLLMTLFTYLRFPVLLTTAGRNNACLSLSLLLAQASLIASTHLLAPSALCTAVGVLTHSCWLWMFTWTFICSFNMFRIFTAKTRITISSQQQNLQLFKTIAGSLTCPVCVVAIVIVASHLTSDGTKLGYGDGVCYLDSTLLLGLSLVLPLALFLTCNMVFFLTTVISIYRIHKLQSSDKPNSSDKKNLFIYMKLSSMTGTFWIMAIVSEATDSDVL